MKECANEDFVGPVALDAHIAMLDFAMKLSDIGGFAGKSCTKALPRNVVLI
jgi:hypothetical protein